MYSVSPTLLIRDGSRRMQTDISVLPAAAAVATKGGGGEVHKRAPVEHVVGLG